MHLSQEPEILTGIQGTRERLTQASTAVARERRPNYVRKSMRRVTECATPDYGNQNRGSNQSKCANCSLS